MEQIALQLNTLGLGEMSASLIGLAALSTSFHFIWGFIRPIISKIRSSIYNAVVRELEVYVADPDFNKINIWIDLNKKHSKFLRSYKIVTATGEVELDNHGDVPKETKKNKLVAGFGSVWMIHPRHGLMSITREKVENKQVYAQTENLKIRFFSFSETAIKDFFEEISKISDDAGPYVYEAPSFSSWWRNVGFPKEVYPPVGPAAKHFMTDVEAFLAKKDLYSKRNVPFKRGYLLYGEPGTGKTSIISHLAHKHSMNLYTLNSTSFSMFDELVHNIKPNSVIVIEDIDFTPIGKKRNGVKSKKRKSESPDIDGRPIKNVDSDNMQKFLNVLDGITEFSGCIIVATTNKKPETLDDALIRPGRLDEQIHIGLLDHNSQIEHINNFYGSDLSLTDIPTQEDRTFAELQYICSSHMHNVSDLMEHLKSEK